MRWIVPLLIAIAPATALHAASSDGLSYVLMTGKNGSNTMISGSWGDAERASVLRAGDGPLLYVRQNGVSYVIRDPAILRQAEAIMAPQQELGRRQGALGGKQGELGKRQGALGSEQARLVSRMANSTAREMGEIGKQMAALGQRQSALGEQQSALGRQHAELGRQQAQLAEQAKPKLRALLLQAIQSGAAQRVQ
jgi:hypothetical protein